jgi:hypothetical protein
VRRGPVLLSLGAVILLIPAPGARAQAAAPARVSAPRASASVDRTAVWVADRVVYTVEIACAPDVDILLDDVAKEKLRLNNLEVLSSDSSVTTDASGRTLHRIRYVLTTYRVDNPSPSIDPISVRYYARRHGERLEDVAPAGDVQVPGALLALRSTLPENQPDVSVRDGRPPATRRSLVARASQIGLALIVVSLAPALAVVATAVRRRTAGQPARRSARQAKLDQRAALERLRSMDVSTDEDRRRACEAIDEAVRGYVASHTRVPAAALTPGEIDAALAAQGGRIPRETVVGLLSACDDVRYQPAPGSMSAQQCREALASAERVLAGR